MADNFTDSRDLVTAAERAARLSEVTLIDPQPAEDCALGNSLNNCRKDIAVKQAIPDLITLALLCMTSALLLAIPSAQADYVASAQEERDWAARIAKAPPDAATLGGAPYPGARIDNKRSGEKNRGEPR